MTFEDFKKGEEIVPSQEYKDTSVSGKKSINEDFVNLLLFQAQLKIMHWGTESYAEHKAYGDIYESVDGGLDTLVESYQGYNERIDFGGPFQFIRFKDVDHNSWLNSILECLNSLRNEFSESDLQNLTDELIADVSKLKYLLTLK